MSVVTVQLGQCGNQIGRQLFSTLHDDALDVASRGRRQGSGEAYCQVSLERFFNARDDGARRRAGAPSSNSNLEARAVLVDMESKAVQQTILEAEKAGAWTYDRSCTYVQKRGSGNNWASGYHDRGPSSAESVLELIRSQAESCDYLSGFLVLMSVAGGTGSGVGSYLTEALRDEYSANAILNAVVWPYASGEVIVQDYNAVLTTKHLQESSDAVILLQNDQLQKACSKLLMLKDISFSDLNRVISHSLAGILQPSHDVSCLDSLSRSGGDRLLYNQCLLQDIHSKMCPLSDFKMLSLKSIPQMPEVSQAYTRYLWSGLLKHLRQMLVCDAPIEEGMDWSVGTTHTSKSLYGYESEGDPGKRASYTPCRRRSGINKSLTNLLVARGSDLADLDTSLITDRSLYSSLSLPSFLCSVWCSENPFNKYEKSCTLLSNSQGCVNPLETACQKAWQMYTSRAYVHQYLQNGLSEQEFLDSFLRVEQVLKSYATIPYHFGIRMRTIYT